MSKINVGQVRPSQLLWTYGPGALVDLPNLSVITMGIDKWEKDRCFPVEEARLLKAVRRVLGDQVESLRKPPIIESEDVDPNSAEAKIGVPVQPFPRWLRCVRCGLLSDFDSNLFEVKANIYRPDRTRFRHAHCEKGSHSDAVPSRFLLACRRGHLDDFPWHWFVHGGLSSCRGTLRFFEVGASMQTENLWVKCDQCGDAKSLVQAFGRNAKQNLPACRARNPHLGSYDKACDEEPKAVLLGSTSSWFPITLSVLDIPYIGDTLSQLVENGWMDFQDVESYDELKGLVRGFKRNGTLSGIERFSVEEIWKAVEEKRNGNESDSVVSEKDLKCPEWRVLTSATLSNDWPHFLSEEVEVPISYSTVFSRVLLLKRLRQLNALVGYTRVDAPEDTDSQDERPKMARISKGGPNWVPVAEVHGEGIFIQFSESEVERWTKSKSVQERDARLMQGYRGWRNARLLDPDIGYPGARFAMLHSFAHLLIRELALECGYSEASIRERVYSSEESETPMAGVLLYTAAADSDGTLGGLVDLGKPKTLGRLIKQALHRASICSSDPLCAEHHPGEDRSLHGASCHACLFVAETSCERCNRYLDRTYLVPTFDCADAAFLPGLEIINE